MPAASTAVLEFQPVSADGDFGLRCLEYSTVTITGQPRTAGKSVVKCKLTANVTPANIIVTGAFAGSATGATSLDATGNSVLISSLNGSIANSTHGVNYYYNGATTANGTYSVGTWLARGSGTYNRYVRLLLGNNNGAASVTNGFYSDIDLQAGTAGAVTAMGDGTATSVSITPVGRGFVVRMTGKISAVGSSFPYFHILICSAPGTISYTGDVTQAIILDRSTIVVGGPISDTTFNVDTDTGWLAEDAVCIASTTRTATECQLYPLNANAGASSFTSALYPGYTHSGIAPTQAEIGLITRNVKIRSTSTTLMTYVYCTALSTVTASWAEFYYVGTAVNNKRGIDIDIGAVANPKSFTYCSIHDCDSNGVFCTTASTSLNMVFSNNVLWYSKAAEMVTINNSVANDDWVFDNNLLMRYGGNGFWLGDIGGTFTNNTVVGGSTGNGFHIAAGGEFINWGGNTAHTCNVGFNFAAGLNLRGTIDNLKSWHNIGEGFILNTGTSYTSSFALTNLTVFGNSSGSFGNVAIYSGDTLTIKGGVIAGDVVYGSQMGILVGLTNTYRINLSDVDMSGVGASLAPYTTNDVYFTGANVNLIGLAINCKFGAPVLMSKTSWAQGAYFSFQKFNQVAGDHRTEMTYGQLRTDSVVFHTASPSMKMTPNTMASKLESAPAGKGIQCAVSSGNTVTASVWVRKDSTFDGGQPRLIVRANAAIGINADTVLDVCSDTLGGDPYFLNTKLLLGFDGTNGSVVAPDESYVARGNVEMVNATAIRTAQSMFGGSSLLIAGTASNYARYADHNDWSPGNERFTIECWIRPPDVTGTKYILAHWDSSGGTSYDWVLWMSGSQLAFDCSANGTVGINLGIGGTIVANAWNAVCVDFDGIKYRIYLNGAMVASSTTLYTFNNSFKRLGIGGSSETGAAGLNGYIDEIRYTRGTARYASDSGYTVATSAFPRTLTGAGTAVWQQLTGTTVAATDDGVMEFIVDVDGRAGFINVDDWSFTTGGVTTINDLSTWFNGLPASGTESGGGAPAGGGYFAAGFV